MRMKRYVVWYPLIVLCCYTLSSLQELYFARLDHGLSTLQMVDLALAHLLTADDDEADSVTSGNINSIRECVSKKFQERGRSIAEIQSILGEYLMNVGNADEDVGITDREKMRVTQFMDLLEGVKEATHVMAEND